MATGQDSSNGGPESFTNGTVDNKIHRRVDDKKEIIEEDENHEDGWHVEPLQFDTIVVMILGGLLGRDRLKVKVKGALIVKAKENTHLINLNAKSEGVAEQEDEDDEYQD